MLIYNYFNKILNNNGFNSNDWCYEYVNEYYNIKDESAFKEFLIMGLYLDKDLKIHLFNLPILDYVLNHDNQQIVYDIFTKYLPNNYFWDKNIYSRMDILKNINH